LKRPARILAVLSALVVVSSAAGSDGQESSQQPRFSLLGPEPSPGGEPSFVWSADRSAVYSAGGRDRERTLLLPDAPLALDPRLSARAGERAAAPRAPGEGGVRYRLGDAWTAGLAYRHALLFGTSSGRILREQQYGDFATDRDRDVLRLSMSWDLPLAELDLGYRFESMRAESGSPGGYSLLGVLPESERTLHSLTLGVTRRWGGGGD
jgi:hypothetical protein